MPELVYFEKVKFCPHGLAGFADGARSWLWQKDGIHLDIRHE